jgi:2C-methyl-D-erythritol 2,4-cyclodiphosphate synthase
MIKIGVVGYSDDKSFDHTIAKALLGVALALIDQHHPSNQYEMVSGLTNMGVPKLAYELADKRGWITVGLSSKEAKEYECYNVDKEIIVGDKFGDESDYFIDYIDILVRIGGGKQSIRETEMAKDKKITVYEYDLPRLS